MLKPALARGDLRMIGATTLKEYQKHIEKDPALLEDSSLFLFLNQHQKILSQYYAD